LEELQDQAESASNSQSFKSNPLTPQSTGHVHMESSFPITTEEYHTIGELKSPTAAARQLPSLTVATETYHSSGIKSSSVNSSRSPITSSAPSFSKDEMHALFMEDEGIQETLAQSKPLKSDDSVSLSSWSSLIRTGSQDKLTEVDQSPSSNKPSHEKAAKKLALNLNDEENFSIATGNPNESFYVKEAPEVLSSSRSMRRAFSEFLPPDRLSDQNSVSSTNEGTISLVVLLLILIR
jgi:hypothetical protein